MAVPRCSACLRQNENCNIIDCVSYPYSEVKKLQDQIDRLQARLEAAGTEPGGRGADELSGSVDRASHATAHASRQEVDDVRKAAEEVGVLAVAGRNQYLNNTYGG